MTKEEKEKLKKEYDEFSKKNYYGSTLMYPLYFAFGFSLIIFWLPKDILKPNTQVSDTLHNLWQIYFQI